MKGHPVIKTIILATFMALSGCSVLNQTPVQQDATLKDIEYSCASASFGLKAVNANFAKLSDATIAIISKAKAITDPVCEQSTYPTLTSTAYAAFKGAIADISTASATVAK